MDMDRRGMSDTTQRGSIITFRRVLEYYRKKGLKILDTRDIELPKLHRRQYTWLEPPEVKQMIDAAKSPRDKCLIAMLFSTGCRISELLNLNVSDVKDCDEPEVCGKNDKYRLVFIDKTARKYLNEYLATRKDTWNPLFMSGQRARITVSRVEQIIHEVANNANIDKRVTPHVFRHSTITDYIVNGAPMPVVQQIAGHSNIQTTINIYTHMQNKDKRAVFREYHTNDQV
ncbi:MAG: hypothetical protein NVS1B10_01460 [Candidatus Saccharimonadales bacterium]